MILLNLSDNLEVSQPILRIPLLRMSAVNLKVAVIDNLDNVEILDSVHHHSSKVSASFRWFLH